MDTFELITRSGLEQLVFIRDESVGLKAIIAIHNTTLGSAIGGIRMMDYPTETAMLEDATDLAREMTMRAALADCDLGGASAILWGNPSQKNEAYFRSFGRHVNRLAGQFLAMMEVGTDSRDLRNIKRETDYVFALPESFGGIADATEMTAEGVLNGIKATAKVAFGNSALENVTCLVQGAGRLGTSLVKLLIAAKAKLIVTDKNYDKIKNIQDLHPTVSMIRPEEVLDTKCDIAIPCALGHFVNAKQVDRLKCRAIAGGASNILPNLETGELLHKRGILYTPHCVIDSGELIQADHELKGRSFSLLQGAISDIYGRALTLLEAARESKTAPLTLALKWATERLTNISNIGRQGPHGWGEYLQGPNDAARFAGGSK